MSAHKQVKIADLTPNSKGELSLVFQVHEVLQRAHAEGTETVICRVVDETGIITAYFDQYASKFIPGNVFQIQNLRCRVVDHHLRLEMIKTTVVAKQPLKMGFKDLQNDLSAKFYVTARKESENAKSQEATKKQQQSKQKQQEKPPTFSKQDRYKAREQAHKNEKGKEQSKKLERDKRISKQEQKQERSKQVGKTEEKKQKRYIQKQELKAEKKEQMKREPKHSKQNPATRQEQNEKQQKKPKFVPKCPEIKLSECSKFQQEEATFCVRVNLKTAIKKEKYWMCKVSDQSGSTYFEFSPKIGDHLQDKSWYRLIAFKVFKDKEYGFIATQEKHSSYELLENYDAQVDLKLLWKQK